MCKQIAIADAKYFFHEISPQMIEAASFPAPVRRVFRGALLDDWYKGKHLALAAFDECLYVLLVSFYPFKPCELSEFDLMKILDICQGDPDSACGAPTEVDIDRLHKYPLILANAAR